MQFHRLNDGWNAEPNAPKPTARPRGGDLDVGFRLSPFGRPDDMLGMIGVLSFLDVSRWRFDETNDHAWFEGSGRYSRSAPAWGEFYEIVGADPWAAEPLDWVEGAGAGRRHFLFYFRDEAFECFADDWSFARMNQSAFALEERL